LHSEMFKKIDKVSNIDYLNMNSTMLTRKTRCL